MAELGAVDRAPDGTPLYAARGELPVDLDEQRVQCHLCGGWYRALGSSHLWRGHGVTADEYRELVGLRPRHPLWDPDLIEAHRSKGCTPDSSRSRVCARRWPRATRSHGAASCNARPRRS